MQQDIGDQFVAERFLLPDFDRNACVRHGLCVDSPSLVIVFDFGKAGALLRNASRQARVGKHHDLSGAPDPEHARVCILISVFAGGIRVIEIQVDIDDCLRAMWRDFTKFVLYQSPQYTGVTDELGVIDIVYLPLGADEGEESYAHDRDENSGGNPEE